MDQREIYESHAERYQQLVAAEDREGNLPRAILAVSDVRDRRVVEVGAGTGRITRLLASEGAGEIVACDRSRAMLSVAAGSVPESVRLLRADARALPLVDGWGELAVAGWVFGHFRYWMPSHWRESIGAALDEVGRVLRPGSPVVVIETLGIGSAEPAPVTSKLGEYYAWLEQERGFRRTAIRTDYELGTVDEAARTLGFFFGQDVADRIRREQWTVVPEWTGVWSSTTV